MGVIYKIVNIATDDFYVGSAVNFRRRKWEHIAALKSNTHHCSALQNAWNAYGSEAFEFEVIEEVDDSKLLTVEDIYLHKYHGTAQCYNTARSTFMTPAHQAEVRDKISDAIKRKYESGGYNPRLGRKHTEETKELIRQKRTAHPTNYWAGKTRSDETKQKISEAQKGKPKAARTYTPEGLMRAQENMRKNAREQKPTPIEAVLAKFPYEVKQKYDFSSAIYTGALNRITNCKCPTHGEFSQYAAQFRKGRGCPMCGGAQRAESKRKQMKEAWSTEEGRKALMNNRTTLDPE